MIRRFLSCRSGAAAVEAAFVMPVLFMLGLGAADAGNLFSEAHRMKAGLAAGARYLAKAPDPVAREGDAKNMAVTGRRAAGGTSVVKGWTVDQVTVSYRMVANTTGSYTGAAQIRIIEMKTERPYAGFGLLSLAGVSNVAVKAAHEERWTGS